MKIFFTTIWILVVYWSDAQKAISGTVVDGETNEPVAGCSVFITNTSMAGVTNGEGHFEIREIAPGTYTLVVSHVGFETVTYDFSTEKMPQKIKVLVKPKMVAMEPVVVGGYVTETWEKWGMVFTDYFIGHSANAAKSTIKNREVIRFRFYKDLNRLIVVADEPIIIENKGLGYQVSYQLEQFEINFRERTNFFAGYILFTPLKGSNRQMKKWADSRHHTYTGSMMHFFRSVYEGDVAANGFEVRRVKKSRNIEKDRVKALYRQYGGSPFSDSSAYYERVLSQREFNYEYGEKLPVDSFRIIEKGIRMLSWPDYLQVVNRYKLEEQGYLDRHFERRSPYPARSLITLHKTNSVVIDANGNWHPPQGLLSEWYWAWSEKVGDLLPLDYWPPPDNQ